MFSSVRLSHPSLIGTKKTQTNSISHTLSIITIHYGIQLL